MDVVIVVPVMLSGKVAWICMINDASHREVDLSRLCRDRISNALGATVQPPFPCSDSRLPLANMNVHAMTIRNS